MSEFHQSGLHPDADQLNAFVEQALSAHEREQTLAHLAACPACRSVVSLSLPPAAEVAHPQPEPVRRPWFLGWNLAWPVAAAFAALLPLVLYVHRTETSRSRTATPTEMAESQPAAPPLAPAASAPLLPPSAPSPHPSAEKSAPAATASAKRSELVAAPPAPIAFAQMVPSSGAAAPQPPAASPGSAARYSAGLGGAGGSGPATPGSGSSGIYGGTGKASLNQNYVEGVAMANAAAAPPPPVAATAATGVATTVAVTDAPPMLETSDATAESSGGFAPEAPLPSGLPTLSTATGGRLMLALDTANTLFISDDAGRRWKPVPVAWKGRAVKVDFATPPNAQARTVARAGTGLAGFAAGAFAGTPRQSSGVAGVITDPTGAVIPDASIVLTDAAKQLFRNARTDSDGHYRIDSLAPGSYQLEARAPGFENLVLPVTLTAAQQSTANLTLPVGQATETVTVTAAPPIELDKQARAQSQMKGALAGSRQPTPLFEITTESGERWTSPDGQTLDPSALSRLKLGPVAA